MPDPVPASTTPPPAPVGQSFDAAFPDDGLDTPPAPPPPPAPDPEPGAGESGAPPEPGSTSSGSADGSKATAGSKDATPAAGSPSSKKPTTPEPPSSAASAASDYTPPTVAKSSELKNWATRMGARAKKAEESLAGMQERIAQLEAGAGKTGEFEAVAKELAEAKKRLETYESDIRLTNYERSQEYAEKYQAPYQKAVARAYAEVKELLVAMPNPQNPEETIERAATEQDFDEIYHAQLGQATKLARQKFGDAYTVVLQHRQNIRDLAQAAVAAINDYKTKGAERDNQTKAQKAQEAQAMHSMFTTASNTYANQKADLFMEKDGDEEGNSLLAKGREYAAAVFAGNEGLSPQQIVMRDAVAFNRLASFPRLLRDVTRLKSQLAEATKTIEDLRGSAPGAPKPTAAKPAAGAGESKSWESAFDEAVPS